MGREVKRIWDETGKENSDQNIICKKSMKKRLQRKGKY